MLTDSTVEPYKNKDFISILEVNYQQMFGENPEGSDMDGKRWVSYILSTFVINIVGLNLLISVISENYSNVNCRLNAID